MMFVVVHYQELALKGRNRPWFVNRLVLNLKEALGDLGVASVRPIMGRIEVTLPDDVDLDIVRERVRRLSGIANYAIAERVAPDVAAIEAGLLRTLANRPARPFRVTVRRSDKSFPVQSPDVERRLGKRIQDTFGWPVDLANPHLVVWVEIVPGAAYCFVDKLAGPGGLPTGVGGRVACMLSGGIDSPVAAYRMMKRGCRVRFVHFHSYPIVSRRSIEKAEALVEHLTRVQLRSRLVLVPFGPVQQRILIDAPQNLRVVLYRRFMLRIANRIADRGGAKAVVTGEALGQVASQTLENLVTIDAVSRLPVLRPLIGMDKEEISDEARRLGTYPISIQPDEDCCTLFTPRRPATGASAEQADEAEKHLPIDELVEAAVEASEVKDYEFPRGRRDRSASSAASSRKASVSEAALEGSSTRSLAK